VVVAFSSSSQILDCSFTGSLSSDSVSLAHDGAVGGIIGSSGGDIVARCVTRGSLVGDITGGVIGRVDSDSTIINCWTDCTSSGEYTGGLVGNGYGFGIFNSYSRGTNTGTRAGGLVGFAYWGGEVYKNNISIVGCYSTSYNANTLEPNPLFNLSEVFLSETNLQEPNKLINNFYLSSADKLPDLYTQNMFGLYEGDLNGSLSDFSTAVDGTFSQRNPFVKVDSEKLKNASILVDLNSYNMGKELVGTAFTYLWTNKIFIDSFFKSLGTDTDTFLASGVISTHYELANYINEHNAVLGYVQDSAQNDGYPVFGIYTAPVAETPVVEPAPEPIIIPTPTPEPAPIPTPEPEQVQIPEEIKEIYIPDVPVIEVPPKTQGYSILKFVITTLISSAVIGACLVGERKSEVKNI